MKIEELENKQKAFCPNCERETEQIFVEKIEEVNVRGETIPVHMKYYHCNECGNDFEIPNRDYDPVNEAYHEYRARKGMVQPEEIKEFRKKLELTQNEFSEILGLGIATLNRYENGALQSDAHDKMIRLSMNAENLLHLLEQKPEIRSTIQKEQILLLLRNEQESYGNLIEEAINHFGSYAPSILSGYRKFDLDKFFQVVKYFCYNDRVYKTKLMKLLFYSDFRHFKTSGVSITGARYAHAFHGPVPDQFETWLVAISDWKKQIICEEQAIGDYVGEVYSSDSIDLSTFTTSELVSLAVVKDKFEKFTAKQIREFSHQEIGFRETKDGELISYEFANELRV